MTTAPSEYVIVKREPTQEMVEAGKMGFSNAISIHPSGRINPAESSIYAAMIAVSPNPKSVLTQAEVNELCKRFAIPPQIVHSVKSAILKKLGAA